jgi:hypothetical protein
VPDAIGQRLNALPQEIIPTRAPPNITANKSSEINRSFMTGISPLVADKDYPHSRAAITCESTAIAVAAQSARHVLS